GSSLSRTIRSRCSKYREKIARCRTSLNESEIRWRSPQNVRSIHVLGLSLINPLTFIERWTRYTRLANRGSHGNRMMVAGDVNPRGPVSRTNVTYGAPAAIGSTRSGPVL